MRIGVVLEGKLQMGGGFQQELSTACLVHNRHAGRFSVVFYTTERENVAVLKTFGIDAVHLDHCSWDNKLYYHLATPRLGYNLLRSLGRGVAPFEEKMIKDGIDLVYFLAPSSLAAYLSRTNFMITVWDQCYRDHPEFPEVNVNRKFEALESLYRNVMVKACAILVDSAYGKANALRRYGCDEDRVHVVPFLPAVSLKADVFEDVKVKYGIRGRYIFYPAQFWPHKNHVYIIDGLKDLRDRYGVSLEVVFSGSDKGSLRRVLDYARSEGLASVVHYVGFVPNEDMAALYQQALALVMPTYFGPTNIPPLEAFLLGCPVCYPDLPGLREQVEDAAFLMDLDDPASMSAQLMRILNEPDTVRVRARKGREILSRWSDADYWQVLENVFIRYEKKLKCWKDVDG